MAVLVPVYWHYYGPTNFLYFCDMALILTLVGIWIESPLLVSMCAVGILVPQTLWVVDFSEQSRRRAAHRHDRLHVRGRSARCSCAGCRCFTAGCRSCCSTWSGSSATTGARLLAWTGLAWALILICFFFMPPPNPSPGLTPVNINYVWGLSDHAPQTWVSPGVWLAGLIVGLPLLLFAPAHFCWRASCRSARLSDRMTVSHRRRPMAAAALRAARPARRAARLLRVHRLHRARRDGDRRRRLGGGEPRRRARARGPGDPRRRPVVQAHPARGERATSAPSSTRRAACRRSRPCARWRAPTDGRTALVEMKAVDAAYPLYGAVEARSAAGRSPRRWRSATACSAPPPIRRCWRGSISSPARGSRSARRRSRFAPRSASEPDKLAGGIGFGPRLLVSERGAARDRPAAARQPGALALSRARLPATTSGRDACARSPRRPRRAFRRPAGRSARAPMPRPRSSATSSASRNT